MLLQYGLGSRGYILSRTILEENKIYNHTNQKTKTKPTPMPTPTTTATPTTTPTPTTKEKNIFLFCGLLSFCRLDISGAVAGEMSSALHFFGSFCVFCCIFSVFFW